MLKVRVSLRLVPKSVARLRDAAKKTGKQPGEIVDDLLAGYLSLYIATKEKPKEPRKPRSLE